MTTKADQVFSSMLTVEGQWGICDKHLHNGVRNACLYCAYTENNSALSQIDYLAQSVLIRDASYQVSWFDIECDPGEVVRRVKARLETLEARVAELEAR